MSENLYQYVNIHVLSVYHVVFTSART